MWLNTNTTKVTKGDIVILANNRQVLAFKKTWGVQKGNSALPKILSWCQYLQETWQSLEANTKKRLISNIESRTLIKQSIQKSGQKVDNRLLDEVIKNNNYCDAHLIDYMQLSKLGVENYKLFATWLKDYQKTKSAHNLLDTNDLSALIITHNTNLAKPYIYGFKTLTPVQSLLLDKTGYQVLKSEQKNTQSNHKVFQTTQDELLSAAHWAKDLNAQYPNKHIAIICPTLNNDHYQIQSVFDRVFANTLMETGQKSYNISLGFSLTEYPLIRHILTLLELCQQLKSNRIKTETFNTVITSPYIAHAQKERSARALLVNRTLDFSKTHFKFSHLEKHLNNTPQIKTLLEATIAQSTKRQQTHDAWLLDFNTYLQIWGFATDRTLSSTEYQLFNKYQSTSSGLNQLAQINTQVGAAHAIKDLKDWLSQVVFQAQSAKTPIQILGSLEAEGLYFDAAWVLGMTDEFLPATLNVPRFIPSDIAVTHQIPRTSFELIAKDAQDTLNNLVNLSTEVIFSYAKVHLSSEQRPSPLLTFNHETPILTHDYQNIVLETVDDAKANPLKHAQVHGGVSILKNQMACAFSGFARRLNIQSFNDPHIGLNRMEQGNIIHTTLQYFYQEITSQDKLLSLSKDKLDVLIKEKINTAIKYYNDTGFKENEKIRISKIIHQFIEIEKQRHPFTVLSTEQSVNVNIAGLKFNTRLDRLDETKGGNKIIFDYKIGNPSISNWCGEAIKEPQLPIYAISNAAQGAAFIQLNANKVSIKGLSKNKDSLPKQSARNSCKEWDEQVIIWGEILNTASQDFQQGKTQVLPNKTACQYCEFDSLCRVEK